MKRRAFSLIELIIVLVIIGLITAIGLPAINRARADAEVETMRARAGQLQAAKLSLIEALGRDTANTQWNAPANNTDALKYTNLLSQYLPSSFPTTLTGLIPSPFTVSLGSAIDTAVSLTAPDDTLQPPDTGTAPDIIPLQKY
jgi:prepilin-type N-terminal cleavage/methylation domain-containing protein